MRLTVAQRRLIEQVLDALSLRARCRERPTPRELRDYERAVALVREIPAGQRRRLRSDFNGKRRSRSAQFHVVEPEID